MFGEAGSVMEQLPAAPGNQKEVSVTESARRSGHRLGQSFVSSLLVFAKTPAGNSLQGMHVA